MMTDEIAPKTADSQPSSEEQEKTVDRYLEVKGLGFDLQSLLKHVEMKLEVQVDQWMQMVELCEHNGRFQKVRRDKQKELDGMRSHARTLANRQREQEMVEKRNERNQAKMKAKERVLGIVTKRLMTRSPPPVKTVVEKKVIVDKEKLNQMKYLGLTLDDEVLAAGYQSQSPR